MKKETSWRGKYIDKAPNSGEAELDFGHNSDEETWGFLLEPTPTG